jgi:hypothetical protein
VGGDKTWGKSSGKSRWLSRWKESAIGRLQLRLDGGERRRQGSFGVVENGGIRRLLHRRGALLIAGAKWDRWRARGKRLGGWRQFG